MTGGWIDAIQCGRYRLEGNMLIEEWIKSADQTETRTIELWELAADQFVVKETSPQFDFPLLVAYRRAPLKASGHSPRRRPLDRQIQWEMATKSDQIADFYISYKSVVNGATWLIAVNDFPAELLYSLIVDGKEAKSFNEWPQDWVRPEGKQIQAKPDVNQSCVGEGDTLGGSLR